jgi:hypothetical protein
MNKQYMSCFLVLGGFNAWGSNDGSDWTGLLAGGKHDCRRRDCGLDIVCVVFLFLSVTSHTTSRGVCVSALLAFFLGILL